jgi:uncharacterized protein YdhG (YjbR/CyaY superfamily)
MPDTVSTIDEYFDKFPDNVRDLLESIREKIHVVAPDVKETISYQIAAFKLDGKILVYLAGWKDHVSLYPIPPGGDTAFSKELNKHQSGKGTARFALDRPLPGEFIRRFVELHEKRIR